MAAPYNPPVKAEDFKFTVGLQDMASVGRLLSGVSLSAGDVKVKKDGGAAANIGTLPTVDGYELLVELTSTEMNADNVSVIFHDQTDPPVFADLFYGIVTST